METINYENELFNPSDRENYDKMCALILSLTNDENTKNEINQILMHGHIGSYSPRAFLGRDNDYIEFDRRLSTAMLMLLNKKTFDYIKENSIVYFHGTNANALPGIKNSGLRPLTNILKSGETVNTGETWSRILGKRDFISFTDVLDLATGYSSIKPSSSDEINKQFNFPVVIGLTKRNLLSSNAKPIHSDYQEIGAFKDIPLDKISIIMVPSDKVEFVRKMFGASIIVMPYDVNEHDRFCYLDGNKVFINEEAFERFKKTFNKRSHNINAVDDIVKKRKASSIMNMINKLKGVFGKDDVIYDESGPSR